jgi:hypothetical protein
MFSSWAYILVGDDKTGKTSFQRYLIEALCGEKYDRLPRNIVKIINHPRTPKRLQTIFTMNRSYQEKLSEYKSVGNYFDFSFKDADICILSSHSHTDSVLHIEEMIAQLKAKAYNVAAIFWSNDFEAEAKKIAELHWQERFWIENLLLEDELAISEHIKKQANEFAELLISRSQFQ